MARTGFFFHLKLPRNAQGFRDPHPIDVQQEAGVNKGSAVSADLPGDHAGIWSGSGLWTTFWWVGHGQNPAMSSLPASPRYSESREPDSGPAHPCWRAGQPLV